MQRAGIWEWAGLLSYSVQRLWHEPDLWFLIGALYMLAGMEKVNWETGMLSIG